MEPEGLLQHSQVPATCPSPEPARPSPCPTSHLLKIYLNTILPPTPGSSKWSLSLRFPPPNPCTHLSSPLRATCPGHLILLGLITRTISGEEYISPAAFTPREINPVPIVQQARWAPGTVWTGAENLARHRDSIPGPSSP